MNVLFVVHALPVHSKLEQSQKILVHAAYFSSDAIFSS